MLKRSAFVLFLLTALLLNGFIKQDSDQAQKITGPITHKNLSIFLIHGNDNFTVKDLLTLQEAIAQRKVIVHETQEVNELAIENISNSHVFIQEGDIVKGGKQDRFFPYDFVLGPKSGKLPISSFCVEQGRWSRRGHEELSQFGSSNNRVASKKMKLEAKENESQQGVWSGVAAMQLRLSDNVGEDVANEASSSSLQLTLENDKVAKTAKEYIDDINRKMKNEKDVIGYVFAINGEINSADIYGNHELFRKMWPKLLEASAIEAISELDNSKNSGEITTRQVIKWLDEVESGKVSKKAPNKSIELRIKSSDKNVMYESYSKDNKEQWIHKNMIKK